MFANGGEGSAFCFFRLCLLLRTFCSLLFRVFLYRKSLYDAEGKRVQKTTGAAQTIYLYDLGGRVVNELDGNSVTLANYVYFGGGLLAQYKNATTYFVHQDHLGSTRLMTAMDKSIFDSMDYLPFGEQVTGGSATTHKFTGQERDSESGLDNFRARHNSSSLGRFMSPDPLLNSGQPWDPRSWNRYSYTLNNPLRYTDPTGLWIWGKCTNTVEQCEDYADRFRDSVAKAKEALKGLDPNSKEAKKLKAALDKIGEEGKGDLKVSFGSLGLDKGGNYILGDTKWNSVTIDYGNVDKAIAENKLNASEAAALDAGVATHEATHAGILGLPWMHGEHAAYYTQSVTYQGLHLTDKPNNLWNERWLAVDQHQFPVEKTREQAIQHQLHPNTVPAPAVPPPGGSQ